MTDDHRQAAFRNKTGAVIRYSGAHATGADGRPHSVRILRAEGSVALEIDTAGALLPLVVDPLAWTEQQRVTPSVGSNIDQYGHAVAVSGGLMAVGAMFDDEKASNAGAVYAYALSGAVWGSEQKIVARLCGLEGRVPGAGLYRRPGYWHGSM